MTFAAVLDGHGGRDVARLASELLPQEAVKAGIGDTISALEVSMQPMLTCLCTSVVQRAASCSPRRCPNSGQVAVLQSDGGAFQQMIVRGRHLPELLGSLSSQHDCHALTAYIFLQGLSPAIPQTPIQSHRQPSTDAARHGSLACRRLRGQDVTWSPRRQPGRQSSSPLPPRTRLCWQPADRRAGGTAQCAWLSGCWLTAPWWAT